MGQRIEDLPSHRDQFLVAHQLDHAPDDVAGQTGHDALDGRFLFLEQEAFQVRQRPAGDGLGDLTVNHGVDVRRYGVFEDRMSDQVADARVRQQGTGPGSRPVIPCGHTDGPVSFLEFVGGPQQLPVERRVVPAFRTSDVGEDAFVVIGGGTCGAGLADRSGAPSQDPE